LSMLHLAIMVPFLSAAVLPLLRRLSGRIHTGWFALPVPLLLFVLFVLRIESVRGGDSQRGNPGYPQRIQQSAAYRARP